MPRVQSQCNELRLGANSYHLLFLVPRVLHIIVAVPNVEIILLGAEPITAGRFEEAKDIWTSIPEPAPEM